jgi:hypothetical protein
MTSSLRVRIINLRLIGSLLFLGSLAGCESDGGPRGGRGAKVATAAPSAPIPEMEAHGTFFTGQIETEVLLGRAGFAPRDSNKAGRDAGGKDGGGGFRGGMGGGGGRRGGGGRGGGEMAGGREGARPTDDGPPAPKIRAVNETPIRLHLRLTNHGTEPVDVEVTDFNSDLGNFVVQPRKISLPADSSVEADPMTSRLGLKAEEIPLTVAIRANGHTEKQALVLRVKTDAPPAASAASTKP